MLVTTKVKIDLQRPSYPVMVNAVQGDQNTRQLEISLFSGGVAWMVPENVTVAMRYGKPDNTNGYYDTMPDGSASFSVSENTVSVLLAPQMLTVPGTVAAQVVLYQGTQSIATFSIYIRVEADPSAGAVTSEDYVNWAQWIKSELDAYLEQLKSNGEFVGGAFVSDINMNGHAIRGLNAPTTNDQAANKGYVDTAKDEAVTEAAAYTNTAVKTAAPRNLLDNSDFRNPVNQRGFTGGIPADNSYFIDRWKTIQSAAKNISLSLSSLGLTVTVLTGTAGIRQFVPTPSTNVTFAAQVNGNVFVMPIILGTNASKTTDIGLNMDASWKTAYLEIAFTAMQSTLSEFTLEWAALYEGEYTAETLPEYHPKGYGVELAECQRYYCNSWFGLTDGKNTALQYFGFPYSATMADCGPIIFPRTMRILPTMKYYGSGGRETPHVYTNAYYELGSLLSNYRQGLNGVFVRVTKGGSDTSTWTVGSAIQFHAHWEASADL